MFSWKIAVDPAAADGSLSVTDPGDADLGTTEAIGFSWAGLAEGNKYLGAISHRDSGGIFGWNLVAIETD